ncbi:MAG: hypothetical protein GY694_15845 [Gammaproteobacteria bacterium]|nr:hypothetical protein [Gammaproteobacteria bacterium]
MKRNSFLTVVVSDGFFFFAILGYTFWVYGAIAALSQNVASFPVGTITFALAIIWMCFGFYITSKLINFRPVSIKWFVYFHVVLLGGFIPFYMFKFRQLEKQHDKNS